MARLQLNEGKKRWNRRLAKGIRTLRGLFHFERLYIGGGHARLVTLSLEPDTEIISNRLGVRGGPCLW